MEEKKKKARGGSYKEHEEYKKRTRPVSIADMVPVKGPIMEAGMGSARKAAVKLARKLMEKTKGAEKAGRTKRVDKATKESKRFERSLTEDDKALMELAEMTAKPKKLTPSARAKNAARDYKKYNDMQDEVIDLIHGTGPAGSKWKNMSTAGRKQLFDDLTGMSYESYMKKYATKGSPKQPKDLLKSLDDFYKAAID